VAGILMSALLSDQSPSLPILPTGTVQEQNPLCSAVGVLSWICPKPIPSWQDACGCTLVVVFGYFVRDLLDDTHIPHRIGMDEPVYLIITEW